MPLPAGSTSAAGRRPRAPWRARARSASCPRRTTGSTRGWHRRRRSLRPRDGGRGHVLARALHAHDVGVDARHLRAGEPRRDEHLTRQSGAGGVGRDRDAGVPARVGDDGRAPMSTAAATSIAAPRSLKEPVGDSNSSFAKTSPPTDGEPFRAGCRPPPSSRARTRPAARRVQRGERQGAAAGRHRHAIASGATTVAAHAAHEVDYDRMSLRWKRHTANSVINVDQISVDADPFHMSCRVVKWRTRRAIHPSSASAGTA